MKSANLILTVSCISLGSTPHLGAWFGWEVLPLLILMASFVGAIVGIGMMALKNHEGSKPIPFGPYLAIAGWITALWGKGIWAWYLGMLV